MKSILIALLMAIILPKVRTLLGGCFCVLLLNSVAVAEIHRTDIRSVEAQMLSPVMGTTNNYSDLPAAQSAMIKMGANRALFSLSLKIPKSLCDKEDTGLYLGVIYDQDKVFLNGELIGITSDPDNVNFRKTAKPRLYLLPKQVLRCNQENIIKIDAKSVVGKRLGPLRDKILVGPWWELEIMADRLQEYLLFFKEIGFFILAITLVLFALFRKYSQSQRQLAFVSFAFWSGLMCVSLSGWVFTLINHPEFLYSLHAVLVCVMLVEFSRLLALYAKILILPKLSHIWSGSISFIAFYLLFSFLPSSMMVQIYRFILLGFIVFSTHLLFHGYFAKHFQKRRLQGLFLILVEFGVFTPVQIYRLILSQFQLSDSDLFWRVIWLRCLRWLRIHRGQKMKKKLIKC